MEATMTIDHVANIIFQNLNSSLFVATKDQILITRISAEVIIIISYRSNAYSVLCTTQK